MDANRELVQILRALAAPARIAMIQLLKKRALCVGALARILQITPGAASQHLAVLKEAGLVRAEKRGYFMHYRIDQAALAGWKEALEEFLTVPQALESCLFIKQGGGPMCTCKSECQKPEELKGKPEECTPEQIKQCHGETGEHPCTHSPKK